jgi:hypothetical protein
MGQPAMFTVAASGTPPPTYQWLKNGVVISTATKASYVTPPTTATDSNSVFTVVLTNRLGAVTSTQASLSVNGSVSTNVRFVAPGGNDSNPGTIDSPFGSIQHCATIVPSGWVCEIRAGTYRETVTPNSGVTIAAYNLESVTVDGSDPVTGWTPYSGKIYKASVSMKSDDTNQVFVGSDMMTEARWPNGDNLFNVNWATAKGGTDVSHIVDPSLPSGDWTGAQIHLWSGSDPFGHETGIVTASGAGQISIDVGESYSCPSICPTKGGRYYLFGILSALDAEREWFYDSKSQTLYFMAPGGVNPSTLDVRAKQRQYAFDLRGKSDVTIQNVSILASTVVTDEASANNTLDRINVQYVSHFTTLPVDLPSLGSDYGGFPFTVVHISDSGIILNGTGNTLQNSTISFSAGAGVALGGTGNTVRNNLIENVDYIGDYASGIDLLGNNNTIQNNTINDVGRIGVFLFTAVNEDIGFNNLLNSMLLSQDGGEIYVCCIQAIGSRIHHNWIHDTKSTVPGDGNGNAMSGVYLDIATNGFSVDQNVLWKNQRYSVIASGLGSVTPLPNYIHNNTIPDAASQAYISLLGISDCSLTRVIDNRVAVSVSDTNHSFGCDVENNNASAPGATEMTPSTEVGCNFDGCSSSLPPIFQAGGGVSACSNGNAEY